MGKRAVSLKTKWQVIGMHKVKMSNRQIGRHLNISEFNVHTTIKNYTSTGIVNDKPRIGRPKKQLYTLNRCNPKAGV